MITFNNFKLTSKVAATCYLENINRTIQRISVEMSAKCNPHERPTVHM